MEKSMETSESKPQPYMNPYLGGMGIGIVLLLAFVTMGRGLGGSSCFATAAGVTVARSLQAAGRVDIHRG